MTRTDLINILIASHGFKSYLEIGCQRGINFDKVVAPIKVSVDPDEASVAIEKTTSDDFFQKNKAIWDVIFIDGLHHADQVERDIVNASQCISNGGFIVLHDCNPPTEKDQLVPRRHKVWYGDVWRAFVGFRNRYPYIKSFCIDDDCGCGVIQLKADVVSAGFISYMPWEEFAANRKELLGII